MEKTLKQLAKELDVTAITPVRWVRRGLKDPDFVSHFDLKGLNKVSGTTIIPDELYQYLSDKKGYPEQPYDLQEDSGGSLVSTLAAKTLLNGKKLPPPMFGEVDQDDVKDGEIISDKLKKLAHKSAGSPGPVKPYIFEMTWDPKDGPDFAKVKKEMSEEMSNLKQEIWSDLAKPVRKNVNLFDILIKNDNVSAIMFLVFVSADSFSAGWVSFKAFDGFWPAAIFFGLLGFAIAYAAIINAIEIDVSVDVSHIKSDFNKNRAIQKAKNIANAWLWSFGLVQFLLHAAAFDLFNPDTYDDMSLAVGKVIICLSIPMGTSGLAITQRKKQSHETE